MYSSQKTRTQAGKNNNNKKKQQHTNGSSQENLHTASSTKAHARQQANPSSLFPPQCAHIFSWLQQAHKNIYFCWFLLFFSWENTKEITPLVLPGSCQNNQCFPERDLWCDMRGGKAEGCRHSSTALVGDNKWGEVLGYVLQLSRLIIFDMHSGVYTDSSVKSSAAIEANRVHGANTMQAQAEHTLLHTQVLQKGGTGCCLCFFFFFISPCLFSPRPISHPRHNWRR